jgi:site-specific recombinase XerD
VCSLYLAPKENHRILDESYLDFILSRQAALLSPRTISHEDNAPLFQTQTATRLTPSGFRQVIRRISEKSCIPFSAHDLRRTFTTLSLKAGMNVLHLQSLLGHSSLEMTRGYVQLVKDDLCEAHKERSNRPILDIKWT